MKSFLKNHSWSTAGICLALVLFLLTNFVFSSQFIDEYYFHGLYQYWREINDSLFGKSPIPMIYILVSSVLGWVIFKRIKRRRKSEIQSSSKWAIPYKIVGFLAWVYFLFNALWGLNYKVPDLKERLQLSMPQLNDSIVFEEAVRVQSVLSKIRFRIESDTNSLAVVIPILHVEDGIRGSLTSLLQKWDMPTNGKVRVRVIEPKGILLRIATAGVYIPFVSEGHIDAGLHFLQKPSTLAHEMSHGYGLTDEGECNFSGMMACIHNNDPLIQYSGYLMYYRYLAYALYDNESLFQELKASLTPGLRQDLRAISNTLDKYPDVFPAARNWIYDLYLRMNGVSDGIKSYGTVISMAQSYKTKFGSLEEK